ncbi:MAG TPA: AAA family ATPase [Blastocatellia bacterium]|nr:AAA family ATPase [Blastocatellia bacterium]
MYQEFYKLRDIPFGLTPNLNYIFKTESYLEVLANLRYGISTNKGLVAVTGEVGMGKTTALRSAIQKFDSRILSIYIFNPYMTVPDFYSNIATGLRLQLSRSAAKPELLDAIGQTLITRHRKGLRTVLIIDEAHGLPTKVLEEIRLLSNFETNSEKLLQIILCGQPELGDVLRRPELRQLKQRISLRCSIKPLNEFETGKYIRFRLKVAGAERVNIFSSDAVEMIAQVSSGTPRVINNICDNALLYGYTAGRETIDRSIIEEVSETLELPMAM